MKKQHFLNMTVPATARRGIQVVKSEGVDTSQITAMLKDLNEGYKALNEKSEQREQNIQAKFDDVVTRQELEGINAKLGDLMEGIDAANAAMAAAQSGAGDKSGRPMSEEEIKISAIFDGYARTGSNEEEVKAAMKPGAIHGELSVGSDPDGGYTAPVEWDRRITDALAEVTPMRRYAGVQRVTGQGFKHLYNLHGTGSGWVGETDARPETDTPKFGEYEFAFGELYANPGVTQRILEDSEIDIAAWLAQEVNLKFSQEEGVAFLSGDGVNKPKGVLMYDAAAEAALPVNRRHPLGAIEETNSGDANGLTPDGLVNLIYESPTDRVTAGSRFYMNRKTHSAVRLMKDGQGNFLWQPPFQLGQPATLLGYGLAEMNGMPDVAADAIPVMFGDMSEGYRIFDRVGVQVLRDPYTAKPFVLFYTRKRVGGGLWNPEYLRYHRIAA